MHFRATLARKGYQGSVVLHSSLSLWPTLSLAYPPSIAHLIRLTKRVKIGGLASLNRISPLFPLITTIGKLISTLSISTREA
uniref:Uncharacterized protein n=2 Tax=Picea TaxID=3328 RepID=A0A101LXW5_PICGL|nr:hypothetical protein ABT39_MTgene5534 [Picea glauca]QHR91602.1 hypothetical protein Q903MT_gene5637 [Picea sitchensis]